MTTKKLSEYELAQRGITDDWLSEPEPEPEPKPESESKPSYKKFKKTFTTRMERVFEFEGGWLTITPEERLESMRAKANSEFLKAYREKVERILCGNKNAFTIPSDEELDYMFITGRRPGEKDD